MALTKTGGGLSSTNIIFFIIIAVILISIFPSTFAGSQVEVTKVTTAINSKRIALNADDYRIIKAMMDRCVEKYLDPSSPPPDNLHEDELLVKRLTMFRCYHLFNMASRTGGKFTPEVVHELKVYVPNIYHHFIGEPTKRIFINNDNISDKDRRILKSMMDSCVKLFLDAYAIDWEKEESDINFCGEYFYYMSRFYGYSDKLTPEFIKIMKNFPRYYVLDWCEKILHHCLLREKHRETCNPLLKFTSRRDILMYLSD